MKKFATIIGISILAMGVTSCHKRIIKGEGADVSETRTLATFSKVEANGSSDVTIVKDSVYMVIVKGYSNLVPAYETKVKGDRLVLEFKDNFWNVKNDNIRVEVHTPYVDKVSINGSGDIHTGSGFTQDHFEGDINGSGSISVSNNVYKSLKADVNGSGTFNSETCEAEDVNTDISGSGDIYVKVNNHLRVRISGSGNVYYRGNPATNDIEISGSGKVSKRN